MSLEAALAGAWSELRSAGLAAPEPLRFMADEYLVVPAEAKVVPVAPAAAPRDCLLLLMLHYLARRSRGLPAPSGEWIGLGGLSVAEDFARSFRKPVLDLIVAKYGHRPEALAALADRLPGERLDIADAGVVLRVFEGVPVRIEVWRADQEFGPAANLLFDSSVTGIFCTEDILVLAQEVAGAV